jgi:hypothetical protein
MIGGIFFLASIIAIFIVLNWFKENDKRPENEPTTGLLAMPLPEAEKPKAAKRWSREDALRKAGQASPPSQGR